MRKIILAFALSLASALAGCSADFNAGLVTTTQNLVALNNALVQVNNTLVGNIISQAKLLAPYNCGAYSLASAILSNSTAATRVNSYIAKNVAANVTTVAVKSICSTLGYPTTVTAASSS